MVTIDGRCWAGCLLALALTACGPAAKQPDTDAGEPDVSASSQSQDPGAQIASQVPDTDIFLAGLNWERPTPSVTGIKNISKRAGYDNQPQFSADGQSILYSSIRDGRQADVYRYLIAEDQTVLFAGTRESEYSPAPMPAGGVSVVQVEADGTQRLKRFASANASPEVLYEDITGVGYYAWLGQGKAALFIVAEPNLLVLADGVTGARRKVAGYIGRSLAAIPGDGGLAFVDKQDPAAWRVVRYDLADGSLAELITTPPGSEDFAWSANGGLFMADGKLMLYWNGEVDSQWQQVAGLPPSLQGQISRIAVSPDRTKLAFVAESGADE